MAEMLAHASDAKSSISGRRGVADRRRNRSSTTTSVDGFEISLQELTALASQRSATLAQVRRAGLTVAGDE
jgi:hypothetical protein